jgi:hypothetical protein
MFRKLLCSNASLSKNVNMVDIESIIFVMTNFASIKRLTGLALGFHIV